MDTFQGRYDTALKCSHAFAHLKVPNHYQGLSNELLHDVSSQEASKLPEVIDSGLHFPFMKIDFLGTFNYNIW